MIVFSALLAVSVRRNGFRFLFQGSATPECLESADADNNGRIELTDGVNLLQFLFRNGRPPAPPGPPEELCGPDTDPVGSEADLGCANYTRC